MTDPHDTVEAGRAPASTGISWGELVLAAALVAIGVVTIADGVGQPASTSASHIGAGLFPIIVGTLLVAVAAALAVQVIRKRHGEPDDAEGDVDVRVFHWWQALLVVAVIIGFIAAVDSLGYVLAAAATFYGIAVAIGARRWVITAVIAVVLALGIFYLFTLVLRIDLPAGILQGIL